MIECCCFLRPRKSHRLAFAIFLIVTVKNLSHLTYPRSIAIHLVTACTHTTYTPFTHFTFVSVNRTGGWCSFSDDHVHGPIYPYEIIAHFFR